MQDRIQLDHVAIAVENLEAAVGIYRTLLGQQESGREEVESERVRVAFFELANARVELLEPTAEDSPIARFLARRGPGLHHITLEVADLDSALARCRAAGLETVGSAPRPGASGRRIAFLHPAGTEGVLIELSQPAE